MDTSRTSQEPQDVARTIARRRQTHELRHERDRLVVDLMSSLGQRELAASFGVGEDVVGKLVGGARTRLGASAAEGVKAQRIDGGQDRWRDADEHFAALGAQAEASSKPRFTRPR